MTTYGQYCPISRSAELLGDRWTIHIVRDLLTGTSRFNELIRGNPGLSRALLSRRLQQLRRADVIEQDADGSYRLTSVHRAGERGDPLAQIQSGATRVEVTVPAGFYDVQAINERDGRVLNIKWAQRLVVMPYPDEAGRHLEVVNYQNGFGAIEVRGGEKGPIEVGIYRTGDHTKEAAAKIAGDDYVLFVVPAGDYDFQVRGVRGAAWHSRIEVPLDRTRLWIVP